MGELRADGGGVEAHGTRSARRQRRSSGKRMNCGHAVLADVGGDDGRSAGGDRFPASNAAAISLSEGWWRPAGARFPFQAWITVPPRFALLTCSGSLAGRFGAFGDALVQFLQHLLDVAR